MKYDSIEMFEFKTMQISRNPFWAKYVLHVHENSF